MSTLSKVLLGLVTVMSLVLFYTAARTLQTQASWRSTAQQLESQIESLEKQIQDRRYGVFRGGELAEPGLIQYRTEIHRILVDRGRAWNNVQAGQMDPNTGSVSVVIESPNPSGLLENNVVYAFATEPKDPGDNAEQQATYLGAYRVEAFGAEGSGQVVLAPIRKLTPEEIQTLQQAGSNWRLYDKMPGDRHDIFAETDEETLRMLLPPESLAEFLHDGEDALPQDPAENVVDGQFVRPLRDYNVVLREYDRQIALLKDAVASVRQDNEAITAALADAQQQVEARRQEIASVQQDLARLTNERDEVQKLQQSLVEQNRQTQEQLTSQLADNDRLLAELAQLQADATARLEDELRAGR